MENRLRLRLTGISKKLTEEAEKRLEASEDSVLEPVCDNGHNLEFYESMGVAQHKIPKELIERQKDFELGIQLDEENDYEELLSDVLVYEDEIVSISEDLLSNVSTIYLKNLMTIKVEETPFEIDDLIKKLKSSPIKNYITNLFKTKS